MRTPGTPNRRGRLTTNEVQDITIKFRASSAWKEVFDTVRHESRWHNGKSTSRLIRTAVMKHLLHYCEMEHIELIKEQIDKA